ncbi:MAG: discoidin domain-containing protein, partial [Akkermansiaceae bacterium]|nr:discoidin domain-containing protein [Akkermansiaceae bacterium]
MSAAPFPSLFAESSAWQVFASGQAEGRISAGGEPGVLRLDYDFHGGGGFIAIRREIPILLPPTFRIVFRLRGEGPPNHFECKVAAPGGADVWRHLRQDFRLPETWKPLEIRERDLPFAWGPSGGGAPGDVAAVELVIAAGPGGAGWIEFRDAELIDETPRDDARVSCSSQADGFPCDDVFPATRSGWRAAESDDAPWWLVDFGRAQRFGGLVIGWPEEPRSRRYAIERSNDGESWTTVHECADARGGRSFIAVPGGEARMLRVRFANAAQAAIRSLRLEPDAFSSTPNEFLHHVAHEFPRGWHARYWHREQSFWTPVGSPEGRRRALINEEGLVEIDEGEFSLEPFLTTNDGLVTWADVDTEASLARGGLPVPVLRWRCKSLRLDILPWVDGSGETLTLHVTYRLRRLRAKGPLRLFVAVRPWQVNPPWQAFRNLGGRSDVRSIECHPSGLRVEGREVVTTPPPAARGAATFEQGGVLPWIARGTVPDEPRVVDANGLASAAMAWELPADERSLEVTVSVPYFSRIHSPTRRSRSNALARWRRTLGKVEWDVPPAVDKAVESFRTAAGHILIHRDGPAIQPGPRRYTRSWVRDCVIMGAALAKAGMPKPLREFLVWYAGFQRDDGFVPCVVDRDGVDWLVEHDSHGQFLWGVREIQR